MRFSTKIMMITEKSFEGCVTNAHHLPLGKSFSLVISNSRELDMVLKTPMYYTTDTDGEEEEDTSSSQGTQDDVDNSVVGNNKNDNFNDGIPTMIEINSVNSVNSNDDDGEAEDFKDKIRSQIMLRKRKALKRKN